MSMLSLPPLSAASPEKQYDQITRYLFMLVDELNSVLDGVSGSISDRLNTGLTALTERADGFDLQIGQEFGAITQISASVNGLTSRVTDAEGNISTVTQTVNGITISDGQGQTLINGAKIKTGTLQLTGAITWTDLTPDVQNTIYSMAYTPPGYIKTAYIDRATVVSPQIYGGEIYATGQGESTGQNPAFYISDGVTGSGGTTTPNPPKGWLCYDKNGDPTTEAPYRVFLHSELDVAMKLEAGGNMSIQANDKIYLMSKLVLADEAFGTALPENPAIGQLFFVI